jgi:hypothetical protein
VIPVSSRLANILSRLNRAEFDEMFQRIGPNTYRIKQPLYLEPSTNPSLAASRLSTQNTNGVYVYEGVRRTSRKEIYIDLNAGRGYRPKMYISNGSHIVKTSDVVPETINPITLEQRGHILRIKQSKKPRYIDEGNRRRRDTKARRYRQLLRFVNQTYGRYSDVKDIAEAWENTQSLSGFVEAVAVNEALDRVYAKRSELIRQRVYEPLNIGGTPLALRTAWKLWAPARSYGP